MAAFARAVRRLVGGRLAAKVCVLELRFTRHTHALDYDEQICCNARCVCESTLFLRPMRRLAGARRAFCVTHL